MNDEEQVKLKATDPARARAEFREKYDKEQMARTGLLGSPNPPIVESYLDHLRNELKRTNSRVDLLVIFGSIMSISTIAMFIYLVSKGA